MSRPTRAVTAAALLSLLSAAPPSRAQRPDCDTATPPLHLPLAPEPPREVIQSFDGTRTHHGRERWAWDFAMPIGTPVLAAADGVVVEVVDGFDEGGDDRALRDRVNRVVIDHGGNRLSVYQHLARGALVAEGERVQRGQTIGRSGNSGWTTQPHLHFHVVDHVNQTRPVCFADVPEGMPHLGKSYPAPPQKPTALSKLPRDTFAANGVLLTSDLFTRWLSRTPRFRITGTVSRPAQQVAVWISPIDGDKASKWWYGDVDKKGRFAVDVYLGEEDGLRGFSMAITDAEGRFRSDFSVPVNLHWRAR